jgi:aminoglycoside 6-adenylyltransferase
MAMPVEQPEMIERFTRWSEGQQLVRAMLLTSTRSIPGGAVDQFSDYDVILVMGDILTFHEEHGWLEAFGPVLAVYHDPLREEYGTQTSGYVVQYADGLKIDFTLWPAAVLQAIVSSADLPEELDAGYLVLLDKDGLARQLKPPTYRAYIPRPPDEAAFLEKIENFFVDAVYVAKYLRRDDLPGAKVVLDYFIRVENLIPMLEWHAAIDHDWKLKTGIYGRGLKRRLRPDLWERFERTYAGAGIAENRRALWETVALFRDSAREVAVRMGFAYPEALDRKSCDLLLKFEQD